MALNTGGVSYKEGVVACSKPGFAKIRFDDLDGMLSAWLPVVMRKTLKDKECFTLDIGEQVACVVDEYFEGGVVLGAIYSDVDAPDTDSSDVYRFSFFDGGLFEYNRKSGLLKITVIGETIINSKGNATVISPAVLIESPNTKCAGNLEVMGSLSFFGGMTGENASGGAACLFKGAMGIEGRLEVVGDIHATGKILDDGGNSNHHEHQY